MVFFFSVSLLRTLADYGKLTLLSTKTDNAGEPMKKRISFLLAALLILGLLSGCTPTATSSTQESDATQPIPQSPTAPADGDPKDVTCKGSYSSVTFNRELIAKVSGINKAPTQL